MVDNSYFIIFVLLLFYYYASASLLKKSCIEIAVCLWYHGVEQYVMYEDLGLKPFMHRPIFYDTK